MSDVIDRAKIIEMLNQSRYVVPLITTDFFYNEQCVEEFDAAKKVQKEMILVVDENIPSEYQQVLEELTRGCNVKNMIKVDFSFYDPSVLADKIASTIASLDATRK